MSLDKRLLVLPLGLNQPVSHCLKRGGIRNSTYICMPFVSRQFTSPRLSVNITHLSETTGNNLLLLELFAENEKLFHRWQNTDESMTITQLSELSFPASLPVKNPLFINTFDTCTTIKQIYCVGCGFCQNKTCLSSARE